MAATYTSAAITNFNSVLDFQYHESDHLNWAHRLNMTDKMIESIDAQLRAGHLDTAEGYQVLAHMRDKMKSAYGNQLLNDKIAHDSYFSDINNSIERKLDTINQYLSNQHNAAPVTPTPITPTPTPTPTTPQPTPLPVVSTPNPTPTPRPYTRGDAGERYFKKITDEKTLKPSFAQPKKKSKWGRRIRNATIGAGLIALGWLGGSYFNGCDKDDNAAATYRNNDSAIVDTNQAGNNASKNKTANGDVTYNINLFPLCCGKKEGRYQQQQATRETTTDTATTPSSIDTTVQTQENAQETTSGVTNWDYVDESNTPIDQRLKPAGWGNKTLDQVAQEATTVVTPVPVKTEGKQTVETPQKTATSDIGPDFYRQVIEPFNDKAAHTINTALAGPYDIVGDNKTIRAIDPTVPFCGEKDTSWRIRVYNDDIKPDTPINEVTKQVLKNVRSIDTILQAQGSSFDQRYADHISASRAQINNAIDGYLLSHGNNAIDAGEVNQAQQKWVQYLWANSFDDVVRANAFLEMIRHGNTLKEPLSLGGGVE